MDITINEKFKTLIPPLINEEYQQLEENIIKFGCLDAIKVWQNMIVDGHNRYEICNNHNLKYKIESIDGLGLETEDDVQIWIIDNQKGRRNINDAVRIKLGLQRANLLKPKADENKKIAMEKARQSNPKVDESLLLTQVTTTETPENKINIRKTAAEYAGVGEGTVYKYKKIEEEGSPELLNQVLKGEKKIGTAYSEIQEKNKKKANEGKETKKCNVCNKKLPLHYFYEGVGRCVTCYNEQKSQRAKKSYMTSVTGEVYTIDENKFKGVDYDAVEQSVKGENVHLEVIIDPKAECMEFQACVRSFRLQNGKYIDNEGIINMMDKETKSNMLMSIEQLEQLITKIKNKIKGEL